MYNLFAMPEEKKESPQEHSEPHHITSHHHEIKTMLSWKAMARPYKKRKREFYLMTLFILLCICIILFLFKEWMLMLAAISVAFLSIVLATTKPHEIEHRITTQGVISEDHAYLYKELYDFWFEEKDGLDVLHIRTVAFFPGVISLLLGDKSKDEVRDTLIKHLPYREVMPKTFMDKSSKWLTKHFPLESNS
jgi:hypothetical protein